MKTLMERQVELLEILAEGCKKHPAYRVHRSATGKSDEYVIVWNARLELKELHFS